MRTGNGSLSVRAAAALGAALALVGIAAVASAVRRPAGALAVPAGSPAATVAEPLQAPQRLSETGLYLADGTLDPRNRPFVPQYPLWSDGAAKSRWIRLPEGAAIDVSDLDAWRFPPGTTFWKEFAWAGHKVETRMIRRGESEWLFATYVWTEDQTEAWLAPAQGVAAAFEIAPGKWHAIPGTGDCLACHASSPAVVLGFNALQLSDDRDPLAPHAEPLAAGALTLRTLVEEDRFDPARPELAVHPPRVRERDPLGRAAIGYLSANCGGCHNAQGPLARLGFVLLHDASGAPETPEPALVTAVGVAGRYAVAGASDADSRLVAAGLPEKSAVLDRMRSRRPSRQMPPLGTVLPDEEAIELVRSWIESLAAPAAPAAIASAGAGASSTTAVPAAGGASSPQPPAGRSPTR